VRSENLFLPLKRCKESRAAHRNKERAGKLSLTSQERTATAGDLAEMLSLTSKENRMCETDHPGDKTTESKVCFGRTGLSAEAEKQRRGGLMTGWGSIR